MLLYHHDDCLYPTDTNQTATFSDDEILLARVVPYLVSLLSDPAALVRARSLRALTAVTARVRSLPVGEANLFPEYIFPAIEVRLFGLVWFGLGSEMAGHIIRWLSE